MTVSSVTRSVAVSCRRHEPRRRHVDPAGGQMSANVVAVENGCRGAALSPRLPPQVASSAAS